MADKIQAAIDKLVNMQMADSGNLTLWQHEQLGEAILLIHQARCIHINREGDAHPHCADCGAEV